MLLIIILKVLNLTSQVVHKYLLEDQEDDILRPLSKLL